MRYSGDPYWITCRYPGKCSGCGAEIPKGKRAFRYKCGSLYCDTPDCGQAASRDFDAAAADEDRYSNPASNRVGGYGNPWG